VLPHSPQGLPPDSTASDAAPDPSADAPAKADAPANADASTNADASASADRASEACRSVQLRRRFRKLAGGLVSSKEGVVLQGSRQGLPEPGRWMCDIVRALRLQCRVRQLAGGLECREEGVVLF